MQPPPIGEAISKGLAAFKANMGPTLIGFICAWVVSLIPLVGGMLAFPGFMAVGLKSIRGQKAEPKDGFIAFDKAVDHLVMGLLQICGLVLCCIGVLVTQPLFMMGTPMIVDKKMTWQQAKDACMAQVKPNFIGWFIFLFVIGLFSGAPIIAAGIVTMIVGLIDLGAIGCIVSIAAYGVGLVATFFTAPTAICALAYGYEKTFGSSGAPAPMAPPA